MRLSKKIAAVALAAVMSVSLLTACGGTDAPSSSNPGSSSSSSSSSADSNSSSGSASDSSSASSSSGSSSNSSSNSSTEDKEENVAYKNSRTAKFYKKLGTGNYTMNETVQAEMNVQGTNVKVTIDALVSTDGKRVYMKQTLRMAGMKDQTQIGLVDLTTKKGCMLINYPRPDADGKLGSYTVETVKGDLQEAVSPVAPVEGLAFKQETKGDYYIETQASEMEAISFVYKGNSSVPEYAEIKEYNDSGAEATPVRVEYSSFKPQADAKLMDFETILANYNKSNRASTTQAQEPSMASLILG